MTGSISDRQIEALNAIAEGLQAIAAALRETPQPEDAQIAAPVPAERPDSGSGDSRTLGERLRALRADMGDAPFTAAILGNFADEADRLEEKRARQAQTIGELQEVRQRLTRQVEAIRAAIEREAAHGDAITRCNLVAERFRTVLDSVEAP